MRAKRRSFTSGAMGAGAGSGAGGAGGFQPVGGGAEAHPASQARLAATAIAVIKEVGDLPENIAPIFTLSLSSFDYTLVHGF